MDRPGSPALNRGCAGRGKPHCCPRRRRVFGEVNRANGVARRARASWSGLASSARPCCGRVQNGTCVSPSRRMATSSSLRGLPRGPPVCLACPFPALLAGSSGRVPWWSTHCPARLRSLGNNSAMDVLERQCTWQRSRGVARLQSAVLWCVQCLSGTGRRTGPAACRHRQQVRRSVHRSGSDVPSRVSSTASPRSGGAAGRPASR